MAWPAPRAASFVAVFFIAMVLSVGPAFGASSNRHATPDRVHPLGVRSASRKVGAPATAFAASRVAVVALPGSVDLRRWAVTPGDQGQVNSCVPWVIDYGMLGWYSRFSGLVGQPFAPMYTYSQINGGGDWGSDVTDALDVAVKQGNDTRVDYTQGDNNWKTMPTTAERANAARFKIKGYTTLFVDVSQAGNITLLKQALATNHPVAITMSVRHGFDSLANNPSAVDNDTITDIRGEHEVLAVGYDAAGLIVENSWGTGWANGGFGRISWAVVQKDVGEAETIAGFVQSAPAPLPATKTSISSVHRSGYWMLGNDGHVYAFGAAANFGSGAGTSVAITNLRSGDGYWTTDAIGHVDHFGRAADYGTSPALQVGERVSTISATLSGHGYWLFTNRGRVFGYGDAQTYGDLSHTALTGPIVASVATSTGHGYYLVGSDGGVFSFGDAHFHGSTGGLHVNKPIVGISPTADDRGYWLVASDGGVFAFNAPFRGSLGNLRLNQPVNGLVRFGNGYMMVASDGGVFNFSDKNFLGSLAADPPSAPIIGIAAYVSV